MRTIFVFVKTALGQTYTVASALMDRVEAVRNVYSVSGRHDLLLRCELDDTDDIGRFVTEQVQTTPGIVETQTLVAFNAFTNDRGGL